MDLGPLTPLDPASFPPIDLGPPLATRVASDLHALRGVDDALRSAADRLVHAADDRGDSTLDGLLDELAAVIGVVETPDLDRQLEGISAAADEFRYALYVRAHFLPPDEDAPPVYDVPEPDDTFGDAPPEPEPAPPPEPEPESIGQRPIFLE